MENIKKNFIWNTLGSVFFGFSSLFYTIIIMRINGLNAAGIYTYAFAIASILATFGWYCGKTYQVTELDKTITDTDYLYNRLITCITMIIISVIYAFFTSHNNLKIIMIILLTFYRSIDCYVDTIHAIIQKNGKLYKAGISLFIKTIIMVITFLIVDIITKNIIISFIFSIIISLLFLFFVDYRNIKGNYSRSKFSKEKNLKLFKKGFTIFGYTFLSIFVVNISKYVINFYSNDEIQAIFGIIIMPASFLATISNYIVQPFLNIIKDLIEKKDMKEMSKFIIKMLLAIFILGLIFSIACYFLGIPVLEIVYNIDLKSQRINLLVIMIGSIFYSFTIMLSAILVAMRKNLFQLIILFVTGILSLFQCLILVKKYNLFGASVSYTFAMILEFILFILYVIYVIRKEDVK